MSKRVTEAQVAKMMELIADGEPQTRAAVAVGLHSTYPASTKRDNPEFARRLEAALAERDRRKVEVKELPPRPSEEDKLQLQRAELDRQRAELRAARSDLAKQLAELDRTSELVSAVRGSVAATEPVPFRAKPPAADAPKHEWVLVLSDWHVGQFTTLEETGGLYEQSTEIALEQVQTLWDAVAYIHAIESQGRDIRKLHILSLGDMVDGDLMRVSQTRKVDRLVAEQHPLVAALMEALVAAALTKFAEVEVDIVGGNHDRFGKYGDAGLGELAYIENWSFILGTQLEAKFALEPRVTVRNHQSFFGTKMVAGWKFAFSHGSDVNWRSNSYAGIPYYSLNVAGERMKAMVDGYDVLVMGHGHVPMHLPVGEDSHLVMNGSLPGTSTYVQSKYKSIRRPSQTLIAMHHRVGMSGYHRLYLDHEGMRTAREMWAAGKVAPTARTFDLTKEGAA